jgi:hypothetical protein
LGVWGEKGEREGVGQSLQDCLGLLSFLCPSTKGKRPDVENEERAEREGRVDQLGWPLGRFCKERKKKEEEKKKKW